MRHKPETVTEEPVARGKCRHYWVIESIDGPTSRGACKFCDAEKEFKNYLRDCLEVDGERYREWLMRQRDDYEERKLEEEKDILSLLGGGDRDAAKAGT